MAIEPDFVCFGRLSTLNVVVSDLTDSQALLRSAVFGCHGLVLDPGAWRQAGDLLDEPRSQAKGAG